MHKTRIPKKESSESAQLTETVVEGILKKKGANVVTLDLSKLNNAV